MFEVIRSWFVKILVKVVPFVFRRIYSHEKLVGLINITISSENGGIVINCSELPNAVAWIEVTNLSPVKLKLVGVEAILYWPGRVAEFKKMSRMEISPHSKKSFCIESSLNELQVAHVRKNQNKRDNLRLYVELSFESSIRDIEKQEEIKITNIRLLNCKGVD